MAVRKRYAHDKLGESLHRAADSGRLRDSTELAEVFRLAAP